MILHKTGGLECVCCFEQDCSGCVLTTPPIGVCSVCGRDVLLDDFYERREDELLHWDCLDEIGKGEEHGFPIDEG